MMLEVYLMAESDGLVAGFSSNVARLVYALMAARAQGCLKPFISADINWCFAFLRRGRSSSAAAIGPQPGKILRCEALPMARW